MEGEGSLHLLTLHISPLSSCYSSSLVSLHLLPVTFEVRAHRSDGSTDHPLPLPPPPRCALQPGVRPAAWCDVMLCMLGVDTAVSYGFLMGAVSFSKLPQVGSDQI